MACFQYILQWGEESGICTLKWTMWSIYRSVVAFTTQHQQTHATFQLLSSKNENFQHTNCWALEELFPLPRWRRQQRWLSSGRRDCWLAHQKAFVGTIFHINMSYNILLYSVRRGIRIFITQSGWRHTIMSFTLLVRVIEVRWMTPLLADRWILCCWGYNMFWGLTAIEMHTSLFALVEIPFEFAWFLLWLWGGWWNEIWLMRFFCSCRCCPGDIFQSAEFYLNIFLQHSKWPIVFKKWREMELTSSISIPHAWWANND